MAVVLAGTAAFFEVGLLAAAFLLAAFLVVVGAGFGAAALDDAAFFEAALGLLAVAAFLATAVDNFFPTAGAAFRAASAADRTVIFFDVLGVTVVFAFLGAGSAVVVGALRFRAEREPVGAIESDEMCR